MLTSYRLPSVSDDNRYIESLFGTMKTRFGYPKRPFVSIEDAQEWVARLVRWYNEEHRRGALNWVTPMARHTGKESCLPRLREQTYARRVSAILSGGGAVSETAIQLPL